MTDLRREKQKLKDEIQNKKDEVKRNNLITTYKCIQEQARSQITRGKAAEITEKFERIAKDGSKNSIWKEHSVSRNPTLESLVI